MNSHDFCYCKKCTLIMITNTLFVRSQSCIFILMMRPEKLKLRIYEQNYWLVGKHT